MEPRTFTLGGGERPQLILTEERQAATAETYSEIIDKLDHCAGLVFASSYEFPSRYSRWDLGILNPPLKVETRGKEFTVEMLHPRGEALLRYFYAVLSLEDFCTITPIDGVSFKGAVSQSAQTGQSEALRTQRISIFSVIRTLWQSIQTPGQGLLGLYGAFGYDLIFEFEDIEKKIPRADDQREIVFYVPDYLYKRETGSDVGELITFDFEFAAIRSHEITRSDCLAPFSKSGQNDTSLVYDHAPGEYCATVEKAKEEFRQGNLFEVVPGQSFSRPIAQSPSEVFKKLIKRNPSPYTFFINLGGNEFLIGASPEMYVRSNGKLIETCPISGTIKRGKDIFEDARQIQTLLSSYKDEAELTMCTDVDRNDKSRICVPGSVIVKGRRQIEMYSHLIHTVDHVVGELEEGYDALDAFITHMWSVTVTGAPKLWAIKFLEEHEHSSREWYGGAVGCITADGNINTGLSIRMIHVKGGRAVVRAGATTLHYSDPALEEEETRIKAAAFLEALEDAPKESQNPTSSAINGVKKPKVLLIDHDDSFVHTLGSYLREAGADVEIYRYTAALDKITDDLDLLVLSPGPGRPTDFNIKTTIDKALALNLPIFGVCLGLQGLVEYFGGSLNILDEPRHGVSNTVTHNTKGLFADLPQDIRVGRYHSLYANAGALPDVLQATAHTEDGVIMGITHKELPISAVQFHPESIMTSENNAGKTMMRNLFAGLSKA